LAVVKQSEWHNIRGTQSDVFISYSNNNSLHKDQFTNVFNNTLFHNYWTVHHGTVLGTWPIVSHFLQHISCSIRDELCAVSDRLLQFTRIFNTFFWHF